MTARYPYQLAGLSTGAVPTDGRPIREIHFNRIFAEVSAIQATLGKGIEGNETDLVSRLDLQMNPGGALMNEIICEDDPGGNSKPTRRYADTGTEPFTPDVNETFPVSIGYTLFDRISPAFFFTVHTTTADGFINNMSRRFVTLSSPEAVRIFFSQIGGGVFTPAETDVAWFAISSEIHILEDDVAWAAPPVRTGS